MPVNTTELLLQLITALTPVLAYGLTAYVRFLVPKVPGWLLPLLAMALGVVVTSLNAAAGGPEVPAIAAALYSSAAILLNKVVEALKSRP